MIKRYETINEMIKKDLKRPFYLPFYTIFIISIQYESINLSFYFKMDDKKDKKG